MLDVFFLSYNEPFADEHFELLQIFAPRAKRVHGVKDVNRIECRNEIGHYSGGRL